ncbi:immunodominant interspersed repeat antigen, putative [Babesia ovata]|uniref:Immunodominant interspersed repeat antigen, putative n=1 Tax=Babesia ovata TaxID=189622 RepID=A0A2H6KGB3_9APIC|nr:immunodominant interspersed repeat antigen, putative [Babesia ovata]GBE62021.1 immunodominant interspersed repeat antigen, putative [Babesia ovata]
MSQQNETTPGDQAVLASGRQESTNTVEERLAAKDAHQSGVEVASNCVDANDGPSKRSHEDVIQGEVELPGKRQEIDAAAVEEAKTQEGHVTPAEHRASRPSDDGSESDATKSNALEEAKGDTAAADDATAETKDKQEVPTTSSVPAFGFNKEYVSPFSKLLETKTSGGFLESTKVWGSAPTTENVGAAPEQTDSAEAPQKTWDVQAALQDSETLLFENVCLRIGKYRCVQKTCNLSRYNDTEWSTPVPVVLQIIAKQDSDSKRIVCYQAGTGRIQLNTTVLPTMSVNKLKTKSIIFVGQLIGDESKLAPHRIIFQDQGQRDACHELF